MLRVARFLERREGKYMLMRTKNIILNIWTEGVGQTCNYVGKYLKGPKNIRGYRDTSFFTNLRIIKAVIYIFKDTIAFEYNIIRISISLSPMVTSRQLHRKFCTTYT